MEVFQYIILAAALVVFYIPVGVLVFFCMLGFLTGAQKMANKVLIIGISLLVAIIVSGFLFYLFYL